MHVACGGLSVASGTRSRRRTGSAARGTGADLELPRQSVLPRITASTWRRIRAGTPASLATSSRYGTFVGAASVTVGGATVSLNARSGMSRYVPVEWEFGDQDRQSTFFAGRMHYPPNVEQDLRRRMKRRRASSVLGLARQLAGERAVIGLVDRTALPVARTGGPLACPNCGRTEAGVPGDDWCSRFRTGPSTSRNDGTEPAVLERVTASRRRSRDGARRNDDRRSIGRSQPLGWRCGYPPAARARDDASGRRVHATAAR